MDRSFKEEEEEDIKKRRKCNWVLCLQFDERVYRSSKDFILNHVVHLIAGLVTSKNERNTPKVDNKKTPQLLVKI